MQIVRRQLGVERGTPKSAAPSGFDLSAEFSTRVGIRLAA
jgi:hypothetical protein